MKRVLPRFDGDPFPRLLRLVSEARGIPESEIMGRGRMPRMCRAREELWIELRACGWSFPEIGRRMGRDHSTIVHATQRAAARGYRARFTKIDSVKPIVTSRLPEIPDLDVPRKDDA